MRFGLGCITLAFGAGWVLDMSIPFRDGQVDISFDSSGAGRRFGWSMRLASWGWGLMVCGFVWEVVRYCVEQDVSTAEGCRHRSSGTA